MKKIFELMFISAAIAASACLASCESSSDDPAPEPDGAEFLTLTFEDVPDDIVAGPSSYGENLYSSYEGAQFKSYTCDDLVTFGLNEAEDWTGDMTFEFWNGGAAVSKWNIVADPEGKPEGWWYTYENQCSVCVATPEPNKGAGAGGSDRFAVITSSQSSDEGASFGIVGSGERTFASLSLCNTAYVYGIILHGNDFSSSLTDGGWFRVTIRGFRAGATVPVAEDEILLADYRDGRSFVLDAWQDFELTNISKQPVNRIDFIFDGSDVGEWGLNTPAYVCVDNLKVSKE